MSKKRIASLIALCLAIIMVVTACGGSGGGDATPTPTSGGGNSSSSSSSSDSTDSGNSDPYDWSSKETLDITIATMGLPANSEFGYLKDPVTMMLNEKFNIRINAIDAQDTSDFMGTRLAGLIASGDMPDIFPADLTNLALLVEANALLELTQYFSPELTPVFTSDPQFKAAMTVRRTSYGWGDNLYCVPLIKGTHDAGGPLVGDYIRWDLYKELGYPDMKTPQDLLNVLKQMQDLKPENHEGVKAYAVSGWFGDGQGWGDWPIQYYRFFNSEREGMHPYPFLAAMNKETLELYPDNQMLSDDGVFWRTIWFYNQAHQMGILDPESFVQDWSAWVNKLENGLIYHVLPGWMPYEAQKVYNELGFPEWGFGHVPGIGSDVQTLQSVMLAGERTVHVSAKTADPERMVALLDYMSSYEFSNLAWNGIEGVYWEYIDGRPSPKPEYNDYSITDDEKKEKSGMHVWNLMCGYAGANIDPSNGAIIFLRHHPISVEAEMSISAMDMLDFYGANTLIEAYRSRLKVADPINTFAPPPYPDDLAFEQANLSDYVFKNAYNVIRANSDAEYESMKEAFKADLMQFRIDDMFKFQYDALVEQAAYAKEVLDIYNGR